MLCARATEIEMDTLGKIVLIVAIIWLIGFKVYVQYGALIEGS